MQRSSFALDLVTSINQRRAVPVDFGSRAISHPAVSITPGFTDSPRPSRSRRSQEAFEAVRQAYEELKDSEAKELLDKALGAAREMLRKERRKLVRWDAAYAAAAAVAGGSEKLEAEHEASEGFHERWRAKGREVLTKIEWRKRQMGKRMKEEEERLDKEGREKRAQAQEEQKEFLNGVPETVHRRYTPIGEAQQSYNLLHI